jgi:hypothetical protein
MHFNSRHERDNNLNTAANVTTHKRTHDEITDWFADGIAVHTEPHASTHDCANVANTYTATYCSALHCKSDFDRPDDCTNASAHHHAAHDRVPDV